MWNETELYDGFHVKANIRFFFSHEIYQENRDSNT